jgi:hypothetical protein
MSGHPTQLRPLGQKQACTRLACASLAVWALFAAVSFSQHRQGAGFAARPTAPTAQVVIGRPA